MIRTVKHPNYFLDAIGCLGLLFFGFLLICLVVGVVGISKKKVLLSQNIQVLFFVLGNIVL